MTSRPVPSLMLQSMSELAMPLERLSTRDDVRRLLVVGGMLLAYAGIIGFFLMVSRVVGWLQGL